MKTKYYKYMLLSYTSTKQQCMYFSSGLVIKQGNPVVLSKFKNKKEKYGIFVLKGLFINKFVEYIAL